MNCNPIIEYYNAIKKGLIVSEKVRKVYKKVVYDLSNKNSEWIYDEAKANHIITFLEKYCRLSKFRKGQTNKLQLELWQKAMISTIFGFVHKKTGFRKYKEAVLIIGRKNGKSTLASGIGLYLLTKDGEPGAEVYSVATTEKQAKIIWMEAKRMVAKSPALKSRIRSLVNSLEFDSTDSTFRPLCSDSETLDGLNVHGALIDELHAIKDKNLYDVVVDGMSSRDNPLILITSTAGTLRTGIYDIKYEECERVINSYFDDEIETDERLFPLIYELDKREEWTDEKCWIKANPGLGTIKNYYELADKVKKAKINPLLVKNLITKQFNLKETPESAWLNYDDIYNPAKFNVEDFRGHYGIGGVDLSSTTDLTAAKVIMCNPNDENLYILSMYWIPYDLLEQRCREDKVPYMIWSQQGLLRTCVGKKINYSDVTDWFVELREKYGIYVAYCGYDSWSSTYWIDDMQNKIPGIEMVPIIQGKKTLSIPMKLMGAYLKENLIIYNDNPIDKWCLTNTAIDEDRNGNIQPFKAGHKSRKRIDGTAALLDAFVVYNNNKDDFRNR